MEEKWKIVDGFVNYKISSLGRIDNIQTNRMKKPTLSRDGYLRVSLFKNQKGKSFSVHRLVAEYFIENINNLPFVNHIDGNKSNNIVSNLEWISGSDNIRHAYDTGLVKKRRRSLKFSDKDIVEIYYANGIYQKIAEHFDTSISIISNIKNKNKYLYVLNNLNNLNFEYKIFNECDLKYNKINEDVEILEYKNKKIDGFENYLVDVVGNIYSLKKKKYLKPVIRNKYCYVTLCENKLYKNFSVHRLVLSSFVENKNDLPIVNHINSNTLDNRLVNLEWVSYRDNNLHMVRQGNNKDINGINNNMSKLSESDVIDIYKSKLSCKKLSEKYDVQVRQIYRIKNKERWKSILDDIK